MLMKRKSDMIVLDGKSEDVFVCNVLIDRIDILLDVTCSTGMK